MKAALPLPRMLWPAFAAVLLGLLAGCANSVSRSYATGGEPTGLVVLTYTETGYVDSFISPELYFRRVGETGRMGSVGRDVLDEMIGPPKYLLSDGRPRPAMTVTAANPSGFPVVLELPVGDYEFYGYYRMKTEQVFNIVRTRTLESKAPFSIRFSVKPQVVTYIGNLNFHYEGGGTRLGVSDQSARDVPVVQQRLESIKGKPLGIEIASTGR